MLDSTKHKVDTVQARNIHATHQVSSSVTLVLHHPDSAPAPSSLQFSSLASSGLVQHTHLTLCNHTTRLDTRGAPGAVFVSRHAVFADVQMSRSTVTP